MIFAEWMQQARVIRMNTQHVHPAVTSWLGDSIGWWEGDTLVVETHNFTPSDRTRIGVDGVYLVSPRTIVTERFTRISDDEIVYRFTVEDPTWYERPWTGETHFTRTDERMIGPPATRATTPCGSCSRPRAPWRLHAETCQHRSKEPVTATGRCQP